MSHFYSTVHSRNSCHTKCGDKKSGMISTTNGWDIGAMVTLYHDEDNGGDHVVVEINGGSNDVAESICLGTFAKIDGKIVKIPGDV